MIAVMDKWGRAKAYIPNGTQTLSKCPDRFVEGVYPKLLEHGEGCHVWDDEGKRYIDFICGLGPILLGYKNKVVDNYVLDTINTGSVLLSLPHSKEGELAERLRHKTGFHRFKFFKTGSDALTAAVKVARAATKRDIVLVCGYHGWHDWYTIANDKKAGIPKVLEPLARKFKYNDYEAFPALIDSVSDNLAAVVMEPLVYDAPAKFGNNDFLSAVHGMTRARGALFISDEVVTGYRFGPEGAFRRLTGKSPDLACYSKAMANGYPMACLAGDKYMDVFESDDFFVSGTFGGDLVGISAALGVLDVFESADVPGHLEAMGGMLKDGFKKTCNLLGLDKVDCVGFPQRTMFNFPTVAHKALFWQECVKRGVLFGYANFISLAHGKLEIKKTLDVIEDSLRIVKEGWADPVRRLEGKLPIEVFRLR